MVSTLPPSFSFLTGGLCSAQAVNPFPKQKAKNSAEAAAVAPL